MRSTSSGCRDAIEPTTKNVPGTSCRSSTSSTRGVQVGSGPSSKVSAIVRSGSPVETTSSPVASTTEPPRRIEEGTVSSPANSRSGFASLPISELDHPATSSIVTNSTPTTATTIHEPRIRTVVPSPAGRGRHPPERAFRAQRDPHRPGCVRPRGVLPTGSGTTHRVPGGCRGLRPGAGCGRTVRAGPAAVVSVAVGVPAVPGIPVPGIPVLGIPLVAVRPVGPATTALIAVLRGPVAGLPVAGVPVAGVPVARVPVARVTGVPVPGVAVLRHSFVGVAALRGRRNGIVLPRVAVAGAAGSFVVPAGVRTVRPSVVLRPRRVLVAAVRIAAVRVAAVRATAVVRTGG